MNDTLFYAFGIALVLSAVVVSAIGLRVENFPQTRGILAGLIVYFAALVGGATWFAVQNAADDQHKRQAAEAAAAANQPVAGSTSAGSTTQATATSAGGASGSSTLKLSAPPDGTPAYDVTKLQAKAGPVSIDFDNPSPVQHDVAIAKGSQELAKSDLVAGGTTSVSTDLQPGSYTYYCTVPGHRQSGMEGTLTVK